MNVTPNTDGEVDYAPSRISFRCQAPGDHRKLVQVCPSDQTKVFRGRWVDAITFELEETTVDELSGADAAAEPDAVAQERARLLAAPEAEVKTLAATLKVKWDRTASRDTMVQRILDAIAVKAAAASATPAGQ